MREFNAVRAIYYGRNGWAAGAFRDRIREVLPALAAGPIGSINDAIEAHQSKLTLEDIPELFDTEELPALLEQASKAFGNACRYANTFLPEKGIIQLYDELEQQYAKQFWELLGTCGAEKNINGDELKTLLAEHPHCLGPVLEMPAFVKRFVQTVCLARTTRETTEIRNPPRRVTTASVKSVFLSRAPASSLTILADI